jgi:hypothetical protein
MSPSKLRMKLLDSHGHGAGKKDEASGKLSRASPSRLDPSDSSRSRSDASHGRAAHSGSDSGHEHGSGGNFEFHREARGPSPVAATSFFRQVPSKWNDTETELSSMSLSPSSVRSVVTELSSKSLSPLSVRGPATRPPPPKRLRATPSVEKALETRGGLGWRRGTKVRSRP